MGVYENNVAMGCCNNFLNFAPNKDWECFAGVLFSRKVYEVTHSPIEDRINGFIWQFDCFCKSTEGVSYLQYSRDIGRDVKITDTSDIIFLRIVMKAEDTEGLKEQGFYKIIENYDRQRL